VQKAAEIAQRVVSCMGGTVAFKLFTGFQVRLEIGYEECEETKKTPFGDWKTPAHVGLAWKLSMGSQPLISFTCEYPISLLQFAAPYMATVVSLLRRWKVKADLVFKASLSVGFTVDMGRDKYDVAAFRVEPAPSSLSSACTLTFRRASSSRSSVPRSPAKSSWAAALGEV